METAPGAPLVRSDIKLRIWQGHLQGSKLDLLPVPGRYDILIHKMAP